MSWYLYSQVISFLLRWALLLSIARQTGWKWYTSHLASIERRAGQQWKSQSYLSLGNHWMFRDSYRFSQLRLDTFWCLGLFWVFSIWCRLLPTIFCFLFFRVQIKCLEIFLMFSVVTLHPHFTYLKFSRGDRIPLS